ncbi:orotidine-5'-phosphate decarboxylase [Alteromonadaceae bacterium BrNp21-10]|nr:orotidine-5'-phosphate decarboxylase [Alteromonadaceae bacterium BrNp21-10]
MKDAKVIVALDFDQQAKALDFVEQVTPEQCKLKVGKEMFTHFGPTFVTSLVNKGFDVFLDLKFHDIPNTVAKASLAAADLGVWMLNVHASGGRKMMETTLTALDKQFAQQRPKLIAVTVLTSMQQQDLAEIGISITPEEQVLRLARLTQSSGLDGVVCSALEANLLKTELGASFALVTPGIRPEGADRGDQQRVMTPQQAVKVGVDYMVIGRPITQAADPYAVLNSINQSIA